MVAFGWRKNGQRKVEEEGMDYKVMADNMTPKPANSWDDSIVRARERADSTGDSVMKARELADSVHGKTDEKSKARSIRDNISTNQRSQAPSNKDAASKGRRSIASSKREDISKGRTSLAHSNDNHQKSMDATNGARSINDGRNGAVSKSGSRERGISRNEFMSPRRERDRSFADTEDISAVDTITTAIDTIEEGKRLRAFDEESMGTLYQNDPLKAEMFLTAHLLQRKWTAEEGYALIRIAMIVGALGVIVTSIMALALDQQAEIPFDTALMSAFSIGLSCVILVLEFRFLIFRNPFSCRARLRNIITRHINLLRLSWGRGWLAIFVGLIHGAEEFTVSMISGAVMIVIGLVAVIFGGYSAHRLSTLRSSLNDKAHLWLEFNKQDTDNDGYIDSTEFSYFMSDIGLELDDYNMLLAFSRIDGDRDQKISFGDFRKWFRNVKKEAGIQDKA